MYQCFINYCEVLSFINKAFTRGKLFLGGNLGKQLE